MSTASQDSSAEFDPQYHAAGAPSADAQSSGEIWLDGDVLACACPDCGAPMSIRLWLMVADCWRCNSSIELTEEQEEQALRLLRKQEEARREETQQAAATIEPTISRSAKRRQEPQPPQAPPPPDETKEKEEPKATASTATATTAAVAAATVAAPAETAPEPTRRRTAAEVHRGARARVHEIYERGGMAVFFTSLLSDMPAWLVSLVFHAVLLLLLSINWMGAPDDSDSITLSTTAGPYDDEGEFALDDAAAFETFDFEDAGDIEVENPLDDIGTTLEEQIADTSLTEDFVEVPRPVEDAPPDVFDYTPTMPPAQPGKMFAGRDVKSRTHLVRTGGGTTETEAAVTRGLEFLSRYQNKDGSWSLHSFKNAKRGDPNLKGQGNVRSDTSATAMALLPFLGAGQTHLDGEYKQVVFDGLKWLVTQQEEDGDLRGEGNGRMYAHAQSAIALCEAYELSGDEQLREPAQMAINFIVKAQNRRDGGWRYSPGESGDTSVVGWQLMALKSARASNLRVPDETFKLAEKFIDRVQADAIGSRYSYRPRNRPTHVMTAEALLCRQYLGWPKNKQGLRRGVEYLLSEHMPSQSAPDIYYWYYATQVFHHMGGSQWTKWNSQMRKVLVDSQQTTGPAAGSWNPAGPFSREGGRIYMTCLSICSLEVYYRHMPLYGEHMVEMEDFE